MSDEPENPVLRYLRRIDEKLDRVDGRFDELSRPIGNLETTVAHHGVMLAEMSVRMDSFGRRLARIERPLDLVEGHP